MKRWNSVLPLLILIASCSDPEFAGIDRRICVPESKKRCQCNDEERQEGIKECASDGFSWSLCIVTGGSTCPELPSGDEDSDAMLGEREEEEVYWAPDDPNTGDEDKELEKIAAWVELCDQTDMLGNCKIFMIEKGCNYVGHAEFLEGDRDWEEESESEFNVEVDWDFEEEVGEEMPSMFRDEPSADGDEDLVAFESEPETETETEEGTEIERGDYSLSEGWARSMQIEINIGQWLMITDDECGEDFTFRCCLEGTGESTTLNTLNRVENLSCQGEIAGGLEQRINAVHLLDESSCGN